MEDGDRHDANFSSKQLAPDLKSDVDPNGAVGFYSCNQLHTISLFKQIPTFGVLKIQIQWLGFTYAENRGLGGFQSAWMQSSRSRLWW